MAEPLVYLSLRIPADVDKWLRETAQTQIRSKNSLITVLLQEAMKRGPKTETPTSVAS